MTTRFLPFLLILLGLTLPAAAQTPGPARFLLESLVVEGTQRDTVREIVAAESLLQTGREYTEQELREAVYRVKRLPFVLDAEFSLRKGGERGSYQLVITVEETRLLFFSADAGGVYDGDDERVGPGEDRVDWGGSASAGGRWFVGSQGLVYANVQGFDSVGPALAQAGYTRYNLFGRGGFASAALTSDVSDENDGEVYQGTLSMGIPIVGNHSLRADVDWFRSKDDTFFRDRSEGRRLALAWIFNTTDDPLFTTSGSRVSIGAGYGENERESEFDDFRVRESSDFHDFGITARRHWALTRRQSVFGELSSSWFESDYDGGAVGSEQWTNAVVLGHAMDLWGFEQIERFGDFRWENSLQVVSSESDFFSGRFTTTDARLTTALLFRNAWGVTRLSFSYIDNLDREAHIRDVL